MTTGDIDQILTRAAPADPVDPGVLERVSRAILPGLRPVRPLPPAPVIAAGLLLIGFAVAVAGALILGMYGIRRLSGVETAAIFTSLGLLAWLAARQGAAEMIPGSKRTLSPRLLAPVASLLLIALFAILFGGYSMEGFASQGVPCLRAGLIHAAPVAAAAWLILRRGFVVNPVAARASAGALAGLAGVIMLQLHCPNLRAVHLIVWHVAVIPVSGVAGALAGALLAGRFHFSGLKRNAAELMQ